MVNWGAGKQAIYLTSGSVNARTVPGKRRAYDGGVERSTSASVYMGDLVYM